MPTAYLKVQNRNSMSSSKKYKRKYRKAKIQTDLSKNNRFSAEEAKNYISSTEKRKKVPACEILEFLNST